MRKRQTSTPLVDTAPASLTSVTLSSDSCSILSCVRKVAQVMERMKGKAY